jgi:hypothetical protein
MKIPPPDFSLIRRHNREIARFHNRIVDMLKVEMQTHGNIETQALMMGYNFDWQNYIIQHKLIDKQNLNTPEAKLKLYYYLKTMERIVPYEPLAFSFVSTGHIQDIDEVWYPVTFVTFETRFSSRVRIYRMREFTEPGSEATHWVLERDRGLDSKATGDEMGIFQSIFHMELIKN